MSISIKYEELTPSDLENILKDSGIVYLPLGALEWHSNHLPFGLDGLVAYEICKRACLTTGGCVIPPLYFGTDREHEVNGKMFHGMDAKAKKILPGSIYFIKQDLFLNFLKQIVLNIREQGFKKLIIVSAHSGTAQQQTLENLLKEEFEPLKVMAFPGKLFAGGIDHAGRLETNLMMAVNKNLVRLEKVPDLEGPILGEEPTEPSEKQGLVHLERIVEQIVGEVTSSGYPPQL